MQAIAADPRNQMALKNLGAIFGQGGRQPKGPRLSALLQRVRSQRPADRVRPRLRPLTQRYQAGPKALPKGAGDEGCREPVTSGQERVAQDCGPRTQGQGDQAGCGLLSAGCLAVALSV